MLQFVYTKNEKCIKRNFKLVENLDAIKSDINIDNVTMEYFNYLENQQIDGKCLENIYLYDDIPLYYFNKPTIFDEMKSLISFVVMMKAVNEKYGNDIEVITDNNNLFMICKSVFKYKNCKIINDKQVLNPIRKINIGYYILTIKRYFLGIIHLVLFLIRCGSKKNILILSQTSSINQMNLNGKTSYYDTQYGLLLQKLRKEFNILNLQNLSNKSGIYNFSKLKEKTIPFEFFKIYKRCVWKKAFQQEKVIDNLSCLEKFNYNFYDLDLKDIVLSLIFNKINQQYLSYIKEIIVAEKILKKFKINSCIAVDEGDRARCFIIAGNRMQLNTYAIQHGVITNHSPAYMLNSRYKDNILVPKITFVWGEKYKDVLINNTTVYNENNVVIVGQLRTDYINYYIETNTQNKTNNTLTILYATQYIEDLLKPATLMLMEALKNCKVKYKLIIKLHPLDNNEDFYVNMIKQYKIEDYLITKNGDLYDFINNCNIIVSVHSSVIIEGAMFNKPSISILLPNYYDEANFVKDGLSYGVENSEELLNQLYIIYNNEYHKDETLKSFVKNSFYKIDGYAWKRVLNHIK